MMMGGMGVTRFIAVPMMTTMTGGPEKDGALSGHASGDAQCRPERITAFEAAMCKKPVISQRDTEHGDSVKARAENQV